MAAYSRPDWSTTASPSNSDQRKTNVEIDAVPQISLRESSTQDTRPQQSREGLSTASYVNELRQGNEELSFQHLDLPPNHVEEDRQEGCQRLHRLAALVSDQKQIHDRMMWRVRDDEKEQKEQRNAESSRRHCTGPTETECGSPSAPPASPSSSPRHPRQQKRPASAARSLPAPDEREMHARIVAGKLVQQQVRNDRFQDGQRSAEEKRLKSNDAIWANYEVEDRRYEEQTQEQRKQRQLKVYDADQKRDLHDKIVRQSQRDQDREWKLLQAKVYQPSPKKHAARPSSSPAKKRANAKEDVAIYRHMLESHATYNGTLASFQQRVVENEKRTEANWQRVAPEKWNSKVKEAEDRKNGCKGFHSMRKMVRCITSSCDFRHNHEMILQLQQEAASTIDINPSRILDGTSIREARHARCKEFQEELDVQRQEKLATDTAKLAAHRERGKYEVDKKADAAGAMVQAWEIKSSDAAVRRERQNVANGDDFFRKHERQAITYEEFKDQQQSELEQRMDEFSQSHKSVCQEGESLAQYTEQDHRSRQAEKAARAKKQYSNKLEKQTVRSNAGKHEKECQAVFQRKRGIERDFRKKLTAEMDCKLLRTSSALSCVTRPQTPIEALQRRRPQSSSAIRPQSGSAMRKKGPSDLNLPADLTPSSGLFALSNRDTPSAPSFHFKLTAVPDPTEASPRPADFNMGPASFSGSGARRSPAVSDFSERPQSAVGSSPASGFEKIGRSGSKTAVIADSKSPRAGGSKSPRGAGPKSPRPGSARRPSNVSQAPSQHSVASESEDEEFLHDLQARGEKWIRDAYQKMS